jgi:hypothetical protein
MQSLTTLTDFLETRGYRLQIYDMGRRGDILVAISGRAWEALLDDRLRNRFLERQAENDQGTEFFNNILNDPLYLPGIRREPLTALKAKGRSARLGAAIE